MKSPRAPQWEKNNTGSQLCLCSILCCDCFHLVCFLPCRAINPTEIFMKFNNQSFKSLTLSPMAFCKKSNCSITVLLWLPVAREQPQKLFSLRQPLSHKPDSSFRAPTPRTLHLVTRGTLIGHCLYDISRKFCCLGAFKQRFLTQQTGVHIFTHLPNDGK